MFLSQAERLLKKLELIDEQITEVEKLLDAELEGDRDVEKLVEIPGVGKLAELMYTLLKNGTSYEKRTSSENSSLAEKALSIAS